MWQLISACLASVTNFFENWPSFGEILAFLEDNIVAIIDWSCLAALIFIFTRFIKYMGGWRKGK